MIKTGDKVNPSKHAVKAFGLDNMGIKFPCEVVNVFNSGEKTIAQFLCNDVYNKHGALTLRSWDVRYLEPHVEPEPEKPRYKLVPVASLREGDKVWSENYAHDSTISALEEEVILINPDVKWSGKHYAWKKQTALQTHARAQGGRGHLNTMPIGGGHPCNISRTERDPRLDEGAGGADAVPREGDGGTADPVQSPAQPRATVRMTKGRDIKPGERISCVVAHDQARKVNYFHAGPFGAAVLIEPDVYYLVVNDITK